MSGIVFFAVIGAALLHAAWNALVKGSGDKTVSMGAVTLGHALPALLLLPFAHVPSAESLPYLAGSVCLHFGYQVFLIKSYETGDLTQVYPIARGTAPLIVCFVSVVGLGVALGGLEILAVCIIGAGILSLALVRQSDGQRNRHAAALAVTTSLFIASYSLVDGLGARVAGTALGFYCWLTLFNSLIFALYLKWRAPGALREIPRSGLKVFLIGGTASFIAYALVTWAFTQAPIALVTALRESSIIFALLIGVFFLKERLSLVKVVSTMMTLLGAVLLRVAR
ncbi:MAG: DMT family transporter [Pseudomonadota bacterium]